MHVNPETLIWTYQSVRQNLITVERMFSRYTLNGQDLQQLIDVVLPEEGSLCVTDLLGASLGIRFDQERTVGRN